MDKQELLKLVEFCVLMQGRDGILGKAPSYIIEKYQTTDGRGLVLDWQNKEIFDRWRKVWLKEAPNGQPVL